LQATLQHPAADRPWLAIAVLHPDHTYNVHWNGNPIQPYLRSPGVLEIPLTGSGFLDIRTV